MDESYGFTEESKREIERKNNSEKCKKYYERNKKNKSNKNVEIIGFISEYGKEYTNKQLAEMFDCSVSTIKRNKEKISKK